MTKEEFNEKYKGQGGEKQLSKMMDNLETLKEIALHFGITRERVRQLIQEVFGIEYDPRFKRKELKFEKEIVKKRLSKEQIMMQIAELTSLRSTCSRLQVGSIITDESLDRVLSVGYNGNWKGGPNKCDSNEIGNCGCIHSEINSLIKCGYEKNRVLFVTDSPCLSCAKLIINSDIKKVYYHKEYRIKDGLNLLMKANVLVTKI